MHNSELTLTDFLYDLILRLEFILYVIVEVDMFVFSIKTVF